MSDEYLTMILAHCVVHPFPECLLYLADQLPLDRGTKKMDTVMCAALISKSCLCLKDVVVCSRTAFILSNSRKENTGVLDPRDILTFK